MTLAGIMDNKVVQLSTRKSMLQCSACGATARAACNCGAPYVPAGKRAAEAVAANPEKSDRAIAEETGVSFMTIARARKAATATNVAVARVGRDGKKRKMPKPKSTKGTKISLGNGHTSIVDAANAGIEAERAGGGMKAALAQSGLAVQSYICARDIVLLSARTDLPKKEAEIVQRALRILNETQQVAEPRALVRPIAAKIWGERGNRFKSEKNRLDAFLKSVSYIVTVCTSASEIAIPYVGEKDKEASLSDLKDAMRSLAVLIDRIRKGISGG